MMTDILKICKEKDIPFIWSMWNHLEENNEYEMAIKKYLSRIKLKSFSNMTFKDSIFDWELDDSTYKVDDSTYKDIIEFLFDWIEEEHMGASRYAREEVKKEWGIDI